MAWSAVLTFFNERGVCGGSGGRPRWYTYKSVFTKWAEKLIRYICLFQDVDICQPKEASISTYTLPPSRNLYPITKSSAKRILPNKGIREKWWTQGHLCRFWKAMPKCQLLSFRAITCPKLTIPILFSKKCYFLKGRGRNSVTRYLKIQSAKHPFPHGQNSFKRTTFLVEIECVPGGMAVDRTAFSDIYQPNPPISSTLWRWLAPSLHLLFLI